MATRFVLGGESGVGIGSAFPERKKDAQDRLVLGFDAASDETWEWGGLKAPQGLTGTITAVIGYYMASATSGAVRWEVKIEAVTDGDALDLDSTTSYDSTNSAGATVPGTQGYYDEITVTVTNADGITAGDYFRVRVNRDADGTTGTDDAAGDANLVAVEIRDAL